MNAKTADYYKATQVGRLSITHGRRTLRETVELMDAGSNIATVCSHVMDGRIDGNTYWERRMEKLRQATGQHATLETLVQVLKLWNRHCPIFPDVSAVERFLWSLDVVTIA